MTQIELVNGLMETFNKYCYFLNKQIREQFYDQIDKLIADLIERDDKDGSGSAEITRAYYGVVDGKIVVLDEETMQASEASASLESRKHRYYKPGTAHRINHWIAEETVLQLREMVSGL